MTEKIKFVIRIMIIHMATYIASGIIFYVVFNYQEIFKLTSVEYFMSELLGTTTLKGPLLEGFRGILFGIILLVIGKGFLNGKNAWLKLWIVIAGIGIINTPSPSMGSIEGIIYADVSLKVHLKNSLEILVQTFLFSYLVCKKRKRNAFLSKNHDPILSMIITGTSILLLGVVIAFRKNLDLILWINNKVVLILVIILMLIVFVTTRWMEKSYSNVSDFIWIAVCYICNGLLPTIYSYITNSSFKSKETLVLGIIPTILIWYLVKYKNKNKE